MKSRTNVVVFFFKYGRKTEVSTEKEPQHHLQTEQKQSCLLKVFRRMASVASSSSCCCFHSHKNVSVVAHTRHRSPSLRNHDKYLSASWRWWGTQINWRSVPPSAICAVKSQRYNRLHNDEIGSQSVFLPTLAALLNNFNIPHRLLTASVISVFSYSVLIILLIMIALNSWSRVRFLYIIYSVPKI